LITRTNSFDRVLTSRTHELDRVGTLHARALSQPIGCLSVSGTGHTGKKTVNRRATTLSLALHLHVLLRSQEVL